eukprot:6195134-Pleurochrysis_carterae.AAC.6
MLATWRARPLRINRTGTQPTDLLKDGTGIQEGHRTEEQDLQSDMYILRHARGKRERDTKLKSRVKRKSTSRKGKKSARKDSGADKKNKIERSSPEQII